ncbi:MAG TPA: hypothetical protein VGE38_03945 [Nocardioides sp.]|uniref:hypothetical protein n=1 Tax=Nocardioides sp. TaxID=35761 RepID=UPI002ED82157
MSAGIDVPRGERLLAVADTDEGPVGGTRAALYLRGRRIPWEQLDAAAWDSEAGVLTLTEVGTWGEPVPTHRVALSDERRLLELVRERVTASVVLQRGFEHGRIIARRSPTGAGDVAWFVAYDAGVDPGDPVVAAAADRALTAARGDIGE